MSYQADLTDELCSIVETTRRGKAAKTAAYMTAVAQLLRRSDVRGEDGYAAFSALRACAWAEGADPDLLDLDDARARLHYLGRRIER